ncbi:helix-turn-helix domain-containing protein [Lacrimispora sp. 38-1]|uniref:helix-turn-helix domain-containing protein n=1 Tax=Lacrimispora sp. 38-1 TaxID=3125778 RepID=UPI003CF8F802
MPLNIVIREKRKEAGLTQEEIADYLGVSAPAVSKWEKGSTSPDISLLPALARLLKIDINTLLCFHEELSRDEVSQLCKEIMDVIQNEGFETGFLLTMEKIREYPTCGHFIHTAALLLEGAMLMSGMSTGEKKKYSSQITAFYEQAARYGDEQTRSQANFMLASNYTRNGEYDKAQKLLDLLPERSAIDKRPLLAELLITQGKTDKAGELLERRLLMTVQETQVILMKLSDIALKEEQPQNAAEISERSSKLAELFGIQEYDTYIAPLQSAIDQKNVSESISLLKSILSSLLHPVDLGNSMLYRHIPMPNYTGDIRNKMIKVILRELEDDDKYSYLHSSEEFEQLMKKFRSVQVK